MRYVLRDLLAGRGDDPAVVPVGQQRPDHDVPGSPVVLAERHHVRDHLRLRRQRRPHVGDHPAGAGVLIGRTTKYLYTASGSTAGGYNGATPPPNLQYQVTDPRGEVTQTLYDANGDIGETINANSVKTQYTYDNLGRKISQKVISDTEPNGVTTSYSYDADNRVVLQTDPSFTDPITAPGSTGHVTHTPQVTTNYDLDGDITSQVTADTTGGDASRTVSYAYNSDDQKQSYTDGGQPDQVHLLRRVREPAQRDRCRGERHQLHVRRRQPPEDHDPGELLRRRGGPDRVHHHRGLQEL